MAWTDTLPTRMIGGHRYKRYRTGEKKGEAVSQQRKWVRSGYMCRVIKEGNGYGVWVGPQR